MMLTTSLNRHKVVLRYNAVSYPHLDVYKRQCPWREILYWCPLMESEWMKMIMVSLWQKYYFLKIWSATILWGLLREDGKLSKSLKNIKLEKINMVILISSLLFFWTVFPKAKTRRPELDFRILFVMLRARNIKNTSKINEYPKDGMINPVKSCWKSSIEARKRRN